MWLLTSRKPQAARAARRAPSSIRPRLEALEDRCLLSGAGSLDPSFGGTGIVTTSFPRGIFEEAFAVLIQPWDGKIITAGWAALSKVNMALVRYNSDGSLDPTFGSGGRATGPGNDFGYTSATLYPHDGTANDGKIVVAVAQFVDRFNANGTLDTAFGDNKHGGGSLTVPWPIAGQHGLVVQPGGKIVVAANDSSTSSAKLIRYTVSGTVDTSFGSGGTVTLANTGVNALALQADGKLLLAGSTPSGGELVRLNTNGSLDTTFNSAGPRPGTVTAGSGTGCLAISPGSGQIVVSGGAVSGPGIGVARFNADGTPDTTFGQSGQVFTSFANGASAQASAVQTDGKILVAGWTSDGSGTQYYSLLRYNTDGSLDPTFGTGGLAQTGITQYTDIGWWDMALQADGKIITVGHTPSPPVLGAEYDFMVARFLNQPLISSFTASPNPETAGSAVTLTASGVTGSGTITQVAFYVQQGSTNTLLGYGTQTGPGVWTFTFTVTLAPGTYTLSAVAEDSYGLFSDPFALALTVQ
jgi:uncharacterized delta-60 repeat protein